MAKNTWRVLYVVLWAAVIITVDVLFVRHHVADRLLLNVGMVLVFVVFYLTVLRRR